MEIEAGAQSDSDHGGGAGAGDELAAIQAQMQLVHAAAAGTDGVLVLTTIYPASKDKAEKVLPRRFRIGNVEDMVAEAVARGELANVYLGLYVARRHLPVGSRGKVKDIVAVFGLALDDDGDTNKRAMVPPGIGASIELTTCTEPTINRHLIFLFSRALSPADAKSLAELLHKKCGGDHGAKDIDHVWRVAQTKNFPNKVKLARGRPEEPQGVEATGGSYELIDPDEFRRALEGMPDRHPQTQKGANGHANGSGQHAGGSTDREEIMDSLPLWVVRLVNTDIVEGEGDRSTHCFHAMMGLMECGVTDDEIRVVAEGAPFAAKYAARGDLDAEIARARAKWSGETKRARKHAREQAKRQDPHHPEGGAGPADDEEPLPLTRALPPADPFPVEALGESLGNAACGIEAATQAPMAICANSVLAVTALAAQGHADVELPTGERKPISEFFLTIAATGERKTSVDQRAIVPVRERQDKLREVYQKEIGDYLNRLDAWKSERSKTLGTKKLGVGFHEKKAALDKLGDEPKSPLHWLLTCEEPTIEGLAKHMIDGQASMGIFASEGGAFIGGHGFTPDAKLRTVSQLCKLWDNGEVTRVRSGDGTTALIGRRLSLHLQAQPNVAAIMLSDELLIGQGILSRLLLGAPDTKQGTRLWKDVDPKHNAAMDDYYTRVGALLSSPMPIKAGTRNELSPRLLKFTEDARSSWIVFSDETEKELGPGGRYQSTCGLAAKLAEHAARLAGIMTLYEDPSADNIGEEILARAIKLAEYYVQTALRVHGASQKNVELVEAENLLVWLQSKWWAEQGAVVSLPEIVKYGPNSTRETTKARRLIAVLEQHRQLRRLKEPARVMGKMRREVWEIRERIFTSGYAEPAEPAELK